MRAIWTSQRQGDLLRVAWSACDRTVTAKTGTRVVIRVGAPFKRSPLGLVDSEAQFVSQPLAQSLRGVPQT